MKNETSLVKEAACTYAFLYLVAVNGQLTEIYFDEIINFFQQGRQNTLSSIMKYDIRFVY